MKKNKTEAAPKTTAKRVLKIIGNVIIYTFFALCVLLLVLSVASKRSNDGAVTMFGREMRIVLTESMAKSDKDVSMYKVKSIPKNSMVFIEKIPEDEKEADKWYSKLKEGDVLTFMYFEFGEDRTQTPITHRIVEIREEPEGGYYIKLEGDNGNSENRGAQVIYTSEDHPKHNPIHYVVGKVTGQSRVLGFVVSSLKQPLGIALIIIVPCAIIIIMESIRIGSIISGRKKEKMAAENQKKNDEIEELKRKLADLEGKTESSETHDTST